MKKILKRHLENCGRTDPCARGCLAAELHRGHAFTKRAMIPTGTQTHPVGKGKTEVSKHERKLSDKTTKSLIIRPIPKTDIRER